MRKRLSGGGPPGLPKDFLDGGLRANILLPTDGRFRYDWAAQYHL